MHFPYTPAVCGTRPLPRSFTTRSFDHLPLSLSFLHPRFAIATPHAGRGGVSERASERMAAATMRGILSGKFEQYSKFWVRRIVASPASRTSHPVPSRPVSSRSVVSRRADKSLRRSNKIDLADRPTSLSDRSGPTRQREQVLSSRNCSGKRDSPSGAMRSP